MEAIGTASTVEEARLKALAELNAPEEADVTVQVLEYPTKKTLGLFGGSPAKVKASYEIPDKQPKPEKTQAPKAQIKEQPATVHTASYEKPKTEAKPAPAKKAEPQKPAPTPATKPVETKPAEDKPAPVPAENGAPANYLLSILNSMGIENVSVATSQTDEEILLNIETSEDYGNIIGRRGETLDALQYLVRLSVNHSDNEDRRVTLNIGDYRVRREDTLKALAARQAGAAKKYGRNITLDPMNPYERRIIHTAVQEIDGVESFSVGEGDARRVVIAPAGGGRNYSDRGRGGNRGSRDNNHGGRGGYNRDRREKPAPYVPEISENRAPKADAQGATRYGKIEPKK